MILIMNTIIAIDVDECAQDRRSVFSCAFLGVLSRLQAPLEVLVEPGLCLDSIGGLGVLRV